jgi:hypothetical protein
MRFPNPLIRPFVEKVTEKSFDKGLLWGTILGVFVTHLYYKDHFIKLESTYRKTETLS